MVKKNCFSYELACTSLFLTEDGYLRKPVKSELSREIERELNQPPPTEVPLTGNTIPTAIVIDFIAYARKLPLTKLKLKTFEDFANNLWKTFRYLSRDSSRIEAV